MMSAIATVSLLPSLTELADAAVAGMPSPSTRRVYAAALRAYLTHTHGAPLTRTQVQAYLRSRRDIQSPSSLNQALSAIKKLAEELGTRDLMDRTTLHAIASIKATKISGIRTGNWLTLSQAKTLIDLPDSAHPNGLRDHALLALLVGSGVRRAECANLTWGHVQKRWDRWVLSDVMGKWRRIRTIALPDFAMHYLNLYRDAREGANGPADSIFGLTESGVWWVVKQYANQLGISQLAPHDLRRTYAALAKKGGADIRQIQRELGHASVQTTERYLGTIEGLEMGHASGDFIKL